uniref:Selenoprotein H n=1 Tax=Fundulus heteroclitus TaxID=8078 RepID=A0A3Q2PL75_FUNHE
MRRTCDDVICYSGRRGTKRKAEVQEEEEHQASREEEHEASREEQGNSVYGRNAEEVKSALLATRPGLTVVLNPEKPRRNSFEVTLLDGEISLWTGIKKGPPRKLKFPPPDDVVAALQEALKTE